MERREGTEEGGETTAGKAEEGEIVAEREVAGRRRVEEEGGEKREEMGVGEEKRGGREVRRGRRQGEGGGREGGGGVEAVMSS